MNADNKFPEVDATTFQRPIGELAETISQKVKREGPSIISAPAYTYHDLFMLVRQAKLTYSFLFYINSDDLRSETHWKPEYSFVSAPAVRAMIDSLYNITMILQNPNRFGYNFRVSGYRKLLKNLEDDRVRYGERPEWTDFVSKYREKIEFSIRSDGLDLAKILTKAKGEDWLTLGRYLAHTPRQYPEHADFLSTFTFLQWREYSALAHGTFEGLMQVGAFYNRDGHRHEDRPKLNAAFPQMMSLHLSRAALLMLCIITETQLAFKFDGANINKRIHECWRALTPVFEAREIFQDRYSTLLPQKGILP